MKLKSRIPYIELTDDIMDFAVNKLKEYESWNVYKFPGTGRSNLFKYLPEAQLPAAIVNYDSSSFKKSGGGAVGTFVGVDLLTYGYKIVKADSKETLTEALDLNIGNIWGIIIYAHGHPLGYIGNAPGNIFITQTEVIQRLHENGYKIAHAYLMQCFSGYKGTIEIKNMDGNSFKNFINNYFDKRIMKNYDSIFENGKFSVTFTIDWKMEWSIISNRVWDYQDVNMLTIDMKHFLPEKGTYSIDYDN